MEQDGLIRIVGNRFVVSGRSDTGLVRQNNQDTMHAKSNDDFTLLIVCDGMGGHEAGETASAIAMQSLIRSLSRKVHRNQYSSLVSQSLEIADRKVFHNSIRLNTPTMGTTASVVLLRDTMLYVGWVGDSRVYVFRRDKDEYYLYVKTDDHNYKTMAKRSGQPLPDDVDGNILVQAIGGGVEGVTPSTYKGFSYESGDLILVCSDGLTDMVSDAEIEQLIHDVPFDNLVDGLIDTANANGGKDNISVLILGDKVAQRFVGKI